jgi:SAM-dependent methyltransferase
LSEQDLDVFLPPELYLRRKSFEFGGALLRRPDVEALTRRYLRGLVSVKDPKVSALDAYWAREAALLETLSSTFRDYEDYLPGRHYTYLQLGRVLNHHCHPLGSTLDIGCGSGILSRFIAAYTGVDKSNGALFLADKLGRKVGTELNQVCGNAFRLPFRPKSFQVSVSLGLVEHFTFAEQCVLLLQAARVSRELSVVVVPNTKSPIFLTMFALEAEQAGATLKYPQEDAYFPVDFDALAEATGLVIRSTGGFHIVPPRHIPARFLTQRSRTVFRKAIRLAEKSAGQRPALRAWALAESAMSKTDLAELGWFKYAVYESSPTVLKD